MTLIEKAYNVQPLSEGQLTSLERLKGQLYGMRGFSFVGGNLVVKYDASRLTIADVESALRRAGVPVTSA